MKLDLFEVMDFIIPFFMIELFICIQIVLIVLILTEFGVI